MLVKFTASLSQAAYDALVTKDPGTLYYTSDTRRVYKGSDLYSNDVVVLTSLPGVGVTGRLYVINNGDINSFIWTGSEFKPISSTPAGQVIVNVAFNEGTQVFTYTFADTTTKTISLAAVFALKEDKTAKGTAGGYASLDATGRVPAAQLPSYVDDVVELQNFVTTNPTSGMTAGKKWYNSATRKIFTATSASAGTSADPEDDKIYVNISDNKTYRWSGSDMIQLNSGLALGETSTTAYRGDRGKTAFDHSQESGNPHGTTPAQIGAAAASHTHALANGTTPGFSTNDLTNILLAKLNSLTQIGIQNNLTSTSTIDALSAAMGKDLQDKKQNKVAAATAGNIQTFAAGGDAADSGKSFGAATLPENGSANKVVTEQAVVDALSWK